MSSLILNAAPIDYKDNINLNNNIINTNTNNSNKNRTIKNKKIRAEMIKEKFGDFDDNNSDDEFSNLENFKPVQENMIKENSYNFNNRLDRPINSDKEYSELNNSYVTDHYKNYLKNLNNEINSNEINSNEINSNEINSNQINNSRNYSSNNLVNNNELLKKLDNILHLLEEQQEERTNYITEELILYIFLGIFIIYVLDSFVKVGRYTR